ncbi:alkaline proteinase [Colletotrichum cuscutae]|uniref:Alkaline proteinase n=1 Tax=Colletotrichum cuscutae TaxID=1209917 RepID=A0AAI9Y4M9_9PEZI|nr:alkaline proteinase [Colletotrichum cuscutae]
MKGVCIFGIAIASLVTQGAAAPRSQQQQSTAAIPGRWIVTLKSGIDKRDVEQHLDWIHDTHRRSLSRGQTSGVERTFGIRDFHAYTGEFDEELLVEIQAKNEVIAIEPDHGASLAALTEQNSPAPTWIISYMYDSSAGTGTFAYVLDSGIRISHPDFQGRAIKGTNVFPEVAHDDDFGHGTHVAGTIGSVQFGVAKNATLVDVKTTRVAYGTTAKIIEALEWSVQNITNTPGRAGRSVISMSLATATSTALNDAVDAATALGVFVVVGAGNDGKDASTRSPASAPAAFTVGAIDINSTRATWSNFGPSVDVFAAGVDVRLTSLYQDGTELLSGTSMSTPHISGLALYLKGLEGSVVDAPAAIGARIKELATKGIVAGSGVGSPNLVAYMGMVGDEGLNGASWNMLTTDRSCLRSR